MTQRSSFLVVASWITTCVFACTLDTRTPGESTEREGNQPGPAAAGPGSQGERPTGSSSEQVGATTLTRAADCADAELLPSQIDEDLTVGPGCVRVQRTDVHSGATLTLQPGTMVLMGAGGLLNVTPLSDVGSHLVAKGTEEQPILFTSASEEPLAGDWECLRIGQNGSNSELEHVILEYGGAACGATGAGHAVILDIEAPLRAVHEVTVQDSSNYGVKLFRTAAVRDFSSNHFARNAQASILVDAAQIFALGTGNSFEDADDFIEVSEGGVIGSNGTWRNQGVPYRVQNLGISPGFDVTVEAGVRLEMSGTIDAFNANFNIEGTAEQPVVFTSAQKNPQPGDWGCLLYSYTSVTPRIDHAIFEYAGSGRGCLGSSTKAALMAPNSSNITNTIFRYIDGVGISTRGECDVASWCQNQFVDVTEGPFLCESTYTPCPSQ